MAMLRNLVDIILLAAFSIGVGIGLEAALPRQGMFAFASMFAAPVLSLLFTWVLLRLRKQRFAEIGLGRFGDRGKTLLLAIAIAAALWGVAIVTEALGLTRNLDNLRPYLEGNLAYLAVMVVFAFIGPGLYEELTFRGFVMHRAAHMLGASRAAWIFGAIAQAILFGFAHAHQGAYGMAYTGALSFLLALVFLAAGRNLWPLVIGHGLYDATRFAYFYVVWTHLPR